MIFRQSDKLLQDPHPACVVPQAKGPLVDGDSFKKISTVNTGLNKRRTYLNQGLRRVGPPSLGGNRPGKSLRCGNL